MSHSPGPWRWELTGEHWHLEGSRHILATHDGVLPADRDLIASAPTLKAERDEMLDMLRELEPLLNRPMSHGCCYSQVVGEHVDACVARRLSALLRRFEETGK